MCGRPAKKGTNMKAKNTKKNVVALVSCAVMIALAVVLDLLPLPKWPNGGSLSVSAVPIIFLAYRYGTGWGLASGLVYSVIQIVTGWYAPPAGTLGAVIVCVLLDYVLAFTVFGTADIFKKLGGKNELVGYGIGAAIPSLLRFVCSFISGWLIWDSYAPEGVPAWLYSLTYNAGYMIPNAIMCAVLTVLLCAAVSPKTLKPMKKKQ